VIKQEEMKDMIIEEKTSPEEEATYDN